jgi:hypothetical protein
MAVLAMVVLVGFTAMTIDAGMLFQGRRHLQNSADAAALAGAQELPLNPFLAIEKARKWANDNGIKNDQIKAISVQTTKYPNDTIYVEIVDEFDWIFARVLGMTTSDVSAEAAARVGTLSGGHNMMPWGLLQNESPCLDTDGSAILNQTCTVKVGASGILTGWYGGLDYDGTGGGSSEYKANIIDGEVTTTYCIEGDPAPQCVSSVAVIDTLDGNKVGPTGSGIDERTSTPTCDNNMNGTDDFEEVFVTNPGGSPKYATACPNSPNLIIIPIISYESVPVLKVTIRGWSLAYLNGYSCVPDSTGGPLPDGKSPCDVGKGHWEVQITIVDAAYSQAAGFLGAYDPLNGIKIRRLVK